MRKLMLEQLEKRNTMCGPERLDVNVDGHITPQDALVTINQVNSGQSISDTNCDGTGTPRDILNVINYLRYFGNTTAQDMRVLFFGGGGIVEPAVSNAWALHLNSDKGYVEFDIALEVIDHQLKVIDKSTDPDLLSLAPNSTDGFKIEPFYDPIYGTIYRVKGELDARATLQLQVDATGLLGKSIRGYVYYQMWSYRLEQHLTNEIMLPTIDVFSASKV